MIISNKLNKMLSMPQLLRPFNFLKGLQILKKEVL